jgi:hypothetical protein
MKSYTNTGSQPLLIHLLDWAAALTVAILSLQYLRAYFGGALMSLYRYFFQGTPLK